MFYCIEYIDPNINENDRKLQKHETRNILFCLYLLSTSMPHAFHFLSQLSALLYTGSHFLYLDLLVFLGPLNSCPIFPILGCENTSNVTGNLFALKTSQ